MLPARAGKDETDATAPEEPTAHMDQRLDRRTFLGAGAAGAALAALGDPIGAADAARMRVRRVAIPLAREGRFSQGIASGQPTTNGITLWTRVDELERSARIGVEVSTDPDFRRIVHREEVVARESRNFAAIARLDTRRLRAGEQYFYRFETCDSSSPVGRFRTARPADSREPVRIGFFSCQDFQVGYYTAHAGLAAEPDLDLVVCLGDYVYEKSFFSGAVRADQSAPDGEVQTLAEYRNKYALYHSDPNLRAVRALHPMMAIWDDHEVEDNYADGIPGGQTDNRRIPYGERQANGYRAFFEHMPRVRGVTVPRAAQAGEDTRIYGRIPLGANLELFLLDQRQYRDDQPCNPGDEAVSLPCEEERNRPGRTLLGGPQKEFLKAGLERSRATWKVIANQVMVMSLDIPARNVLNTDSWDGYGAERRELLEFVRAKGIENVSFITGDIHTFFAGDVTPSGREGIPSIDGEPVATEFVGGSITSEGIADRPGERAAQTTAFIGDATVLANNPHIKYSNQAFKGYGVLEARPDELVVEYRSPQTVKAPESPVFTLQGFRVASGRPRVEVGGAVLGRKPPRLPEPLPPDLLPPIASSAQSGDGRGPAGCAASDRASRRRRRRRRRPRFTG